MKKKLIGLGIFSIILVNVFVNIDYQNGDIDLNVLDANALRTYEFDVDGKCWQYMDYVSGDWFCDPDNLNSEGYETMDFYCYGSYNSFCTWGIVDRAWDECDDESYDDDMTHTGRCS